MSVDVYDSDASQMPYAVTTLGEVCTIRVQRGNFATVVRLTVDEAQVLREKLSYWLFHSQGIKP